MLTLLTFIAISLSGSQRCDLIELNHCYHESGEELRFTQVVIWDWSPDYRRYEPRRWKIVPHNEQVIRAGKLYRVVVDDIVIDAKLFRETWTNYDPEYRARRIIWR
jgi:hypothetical protein